MTDEIKTTTIHNLIILDESGSMSSIRLQALSGANETFSTIRANQKEYPDQKHMLTFVTFDSHGDKDVRTLIDDQPIDCVKDLTEDDYHPRGCTPLYDAMGMSLSSLEAKCGPDDKVLVTIITDGLENASHEYSGKAIKSIVKLLRDKGWTFAYIGANQDAVEVATELNINNSMNFDATPHGVREMIFKYNMSTAEYCRRIKEGKSKTDLQNDFFSEDKS